MYTLTHGIKIGHLFYQTFDVNPVIKIYLNIQNFQLSHKNLDNECEVNNVKLHVMQFMLFNKACTLYNVRIKL